jgi:acyl-coenzyme A synthetase/AMP-(fatty) acid ligase
MIRIAFVIGGYPPEEHKRRADVALSYSDVETVLLRHEAVKQAVAVGMADPRLAEVVTAFIELKTNKQATEAGSSTTAGGIWRVSRFPAASFS